MDGCGRAVVPREGEEGSTNADNHNPSPFEAEFLLLGEALTLLVSKLRKDDSKPELVDELNDNGGPPSHNYFTDPWSERAWGPQVVYEGVLPIPGAIRSQLTRLECMSFMGLLPEIGHAWVSIDNRLFLWDYERGGEGEFQQYTGFEQLIVSVALVPPKPGLFRDVVKYLLVVSTPVEIALLACTYEGKDGGGRMKLRPTAFSARSDGISMLKSAGHPNGRVFCAGQDGCLYELSYDMDPGLLYTYLGIGEGGGAEGPDTKRRKCEKIDQTSAFGSSLVPAFIKGVVQGGRRVSLVDVVVDPFRGFVATLDNLGSMDLYDLGPHGKACHHIVRQYDVWHAAKEMCARASRWGNRAHDLPEARTFTTGHGMSLVSLHVVDVCTSMRCHLVAVSDTGFRFYMTTSRGVGGGWDATATSKRQVPTLLSILHIRAPPSPELRSFLDADGGNSNNLSTLTTNAAISRGGPSRSRPGGTHEKEDIGGGRNQPSEGFVPSYSTSRGGVGGGGRRGKIHTALFAGGVTIYAESRGEDSDVVLAMGPDTTSRRASNADGTTEELPSLRESVSIVGRSRFQGKVWAMAEVPTFLRPGLGAVGGVGSEIEGHRGLSATHLTTLLATSRTPSDSEIALRSARGQSRRREAEEALQRIREGGTTGGGKRSFGPSTQRPPLPSASSMTRVWYESWDESPRPLPPPPPICLPPAGGGWRVGLLPQHLHSRAVIPLTESSTQCGGTLFPRRFLCLTHTGLHMLRQRRPIDGLIELLQGERYDQISHFFCSYGREEACAMSFAVACQCVSPVIPPGGGLISGTAVSGSFTANLRQSAISAALQHGIPQNVSSPAFSPGDDGGGGGGRQVSASGGTTAFSSSPSNARAVFMDEFSYSFYHDGLALFLSRLLRPALFHPVVVPNSSSLNDGVSKSGSARGQDSSDGGGGTTKLFPLLDRGELRVLHAPLHRLLDVMVEVFPQAVEDKRGITGNRHWGSGAEAARRHEVRSLNRLYKLVHRTIQAIALLNLLMDVSERQPHVKIDWELFRGMQFWELVTSAEAHVCVGRLLSVLLQPLSSGIEPVLADQYADELARSCFLYFSQGDRLTYEGFKSLTPGKGEHENVNGYSTTPPTSAVNRGIELLSRAATFWSSPSDLAPGGRLEMACRELTRLGREDGVVDVCLSCAGNFTDGTHPPLNGILSKLSNALGDVAVSDMEKNLHHGEVVRGDAERKAARDYCYELIFQALGGLLSTSPPDARGGEDTVGSAAPQHLSSGENGYTMNNTTTNDKADDVLSRVLRSNDSDFHTALYDFLRTREAARLVRICSPLIEDYLREKDIYLLYQHFSVHGLHLRALELMADVARSEKPIPLDERIVLLTRAINSGKRAAEKSDSESSGSYSLAQLADELEVAQLQQRVLRTLEETPHPLSSSTDSTALSHTRTEDGYFESGSLSALRSQLLAVSDLYNNYAQARGLWELCLSIIHCCNRDVPELARDIWKSLIYRMVPCQTRDIDVGQWLARQRLGVLQDPPGFTIPPGSCVAAQLFLEDIGWISPLAAKVESLARELHAEGTPDFTFPLNLIVDELEGISCHHMMCRHVKRDSGGGGGMEDHWVVNCLRKAGIPWPKLLLAYNASVRACERRDTVDQVN